MNDKNALLYGLLAGIASAVIYVAAIQGARGLSLSSIVFVVITGLPIAIITLGFGVRAAVTAALASSLAVFTFLQAATDDFGSSSMQALSFAATLAGPSAFISYLCSLAQPEPVDANGHPTIWYPLDRVLVYTGLLVCVGFMIFAVLTGLTMERFAAFYQEIANSIRDSETNAEGAEQFLALLEQHNQSYALLTVTMVGISSTLFHILNLWLGLHIARRSGLLHRPGNGLHSLRMPLFLVAVFFAGILTQQSGGYIGVAGSVVAGSVGTLFFVSGLGLIHDLLKDSAHKLSILSILYALVILFFFPAILILIVALIDSGFDIRRRFSSSNTYPPE